MRLLLDAGNSTVAAALADDTNVERTVRVPIARTVDDATLEQALDEAFGPDAVDWPALEEIALASVVPAATASADALATRHRLPLVVASAATVPIAVRVDNPESVGPDRLVNALAAARLYGAPAVVVDAGTATTWECVDGEGAFVGGAIAPGLRLGLEALAERTALLPRVAATLPAHAIGADTVEAIRSGAVLGHRELVEGLTRRIRAELAQRSSVPPERVRAILTGGLARTAWGESLEGFDERDPDLTLRGLALLPQGATADRSSPRTAARLQPLTGR